MKRTWFLLPLLTIAVLLSGCKNDDDSPRPSSPTPSAELEAEYERMDMERFALMELLHSLAGVSFEADFEDDIDFEGQTYEPVIGEVRDDASPLERFLRVEDASYSEQDFRDLVGDATFIRQTADGCVIDLTHLDCRDDGRKQNFGTLTFHHNTDGSNAGYAEVNVPCIPHLQRIVYLTKEQWGDNADLFESPCTKGDIYFGRGVYWVCVEEALSESTRGVLVNVEPGYGTLHNILWDANYEAHNSYFPTRSDIRAYLRFCADPDFATLKKRILKNPAYDNKIFPRLCSNHSKSSFSFSVGKGDFGFATTEPYYSFYANEGIGEEKKNGACIVYDTNKEGKKKYGLFGSKKRYMYYVSVPYQCVRDNGVSQDKENYSSRSDSDFYEFYCNHWMYICNAVYFTTKVPDGFALQDI